jgi:hypothetical protein
VVNVMASIRHVSFTIVSTTYGNMRVGTSNEERRMMENFSTGPTCTSAWVADIEVGTLPLCTQKYRSREALLIAGT